MGGAVFRRPGGEDPLARRSRRRGGRTAHSRSGAGAEPHRGISSRSASQAFYASASTGSWPEEALMSSSELPKGYLAAGESPPGAPAVVIIHEWWGLNAQIRSVADRFA